MKPMDTDKLSRTLGWLSIGLGTAQILAPRKFTRTLGTNNRTTLVRTAYGLREVAVGVGILTQRDPTPWLWSRVAGDVFDLATLGNIYRSDNARTRNVTAAMLAVAGITALDVMCAAKMSGLTR
jgi:hypothetical protein